MNPIHNLLKSIAYILIGFHLHLTSISLAWVYKRDNLQILQYEGTLRVLSARYDADAGIAVCPRI